MKNKALEFQSRARAVCCSHFASPGGESMDCLYFACFQTFMNVAWTCTEVATVGVHSCYMTLLGQGPSSSLCRSLSSSWPHVDGREARGGALRGVGNASGMFSNCNSARQAHSGTQDTDQERNDSQCFVGKCCAEVSRNGPGSCENNSGLSRRALKGLQDIQDVGHGILNKVVFEV